MPTRDDVVLPPARSMKVFAVVVFAFAAVGLTVRGHANAEPWDKVSSPKPRLQVAHIETTRSNAICDVFQRQVLPGAGVKMATGVLLQDRRDPSENVLRSAAHFAPDNVWWCTFETDSVAVAARMIGNDMIVQQRDGVGWYTSIYITGQGEWATMFYIYSP